VVGVTGISGWLVGGTPVGSFGGGTPSGGLAGTPGGSDGGVSGGAGGRAGAGLGSAGVGSGRGGFGVCNIGMCCFPALSHDAGNDLAASMRVPGALS
jgi:hypothetical protein